MNDEMRVTISNCERNISNIMDEELFVTYACLENYVNRFCAGSYTLQMVDGREVRQIINRYFQNIINIIQNNLNNFLYKSIDEVQSYRNTPDYSNAIKNILSDDNMADFIDYELRSEIQRGISNFCDNFEMDFKYDCLHNVSNQNSDFEMELRSLSDKLQIELEYLMQESRKNIVNAAAQQMEIIRESYAQITGKDKDELKKQEQDKKVSRMKELLSGIYKSNEDAIKNDVNVNQNFKELVDYINNLINEGINLDGISTDEYKKFKGLWDKFISSRNEYNTRIAEQKDKSNDNINTNDEFEELRNIDLKTISIIKENFLKRYPDMEHEVKTVELMIKMAKNSDEFDIVSKEIKKLQETINMRLYPDLVLEYRSRFGGLSPEIDKCIKDYEDKIAEIQESGQSINECLNDILPLINSITAAVRNAQTNKTNEWIKAPSQANVENSLQDGVEENNYVSAANNGGPHR